MPRGYQPSTLGEGIEQGFYGISDALLRYHDRRRQELAQQSALDEERQRDTFLRYVKMAELEDKARKVKEPELPGNETELYSFLVQGGMTPEDARAEVEKYVGVTHPERSALARTRDAELKQNTKDEITPTMEALAFIESLRGDTQDYNEALTDFNLKAKPQDMYDSATKRSWKEMPQFAMTPPDTSLQMLQWAMRFEKDPEFQQAAVKTVGQADPALVPYSDDLLKQLTGGGAVGSGSGDLGQLNSFFKEQAPMDSLTMQAPLGGGGGVAAPAEAQGTEQVVEVKDVGGMTPEERQSTVEEIAKSITSGLQTELGVKKTKGDDGQMYEQYDDDAQWLIGRVYQLMYDNQISAEEAVARLKEKLSS